MQIYSFSPFGYEGALVTVEVDLRRGIPAIDLVGLADSAVKEARERMQAAIRNSGFDFPPERILISLSPADLKKEGAGFDLPIALAVLNASQNSQSTVSGSTSAASTDTANSADKADSTCYKNEVPTTEDSPILIMGELELSGKIRPVRGVHAAAATAAAGGILKCIVPMANAEEAREVSGMSVFGAECLQEAFAALYNPSAFTKQKKAFNATPENTPTGFENVEGILFTKITPDKEFADIHGQTKLVRALQIAAAGGHNLIAVGAPGCGKTLALQKMPALLPALTAEQAQPVLRIASLAGLSLKEQKNCIMPPFRIPHQTATIEGICGGGPNCRPGEISLAHNGVLFLDEAAEFKTSVLQMLRVPLESGSITISRAGRSTVFPANFQLIMATNPCPCGNYGSKSKICLCSMRSVELYWKKFSGPLLDRVDLRVNVQNEKPTEQKGLSTAELRIQIARARAAQQKRQAKKNAELTPSETAAFCFLDEECKALLENESLRNGFSPRGSASCLKVARTIADMSGSVQIKKEHLVEAISFRAPFSDISVT